MPQNNPPQVTATTIVDQIEILNQMIAQYTAKLAEINAAIAVFQSAKAAFNVQLKLINPNFPTL
jgi:hypothetical protein